MADINDFMEPEKIRDRLKEAYEKGYHFEWIGMSHMMLETLLKSYLFAHINASYPIRKFVGEQVEWVKTLSFWNILNIGNIFGLLSNELYDNLKEINTKRNIILHNLIMKNEKLNNIDLEKHYELCQKTQEQLVKEMLANIHIQHISMQVFYNSMKKFEKKYKEGDIDHEA